MPQFKLMAAVAESTGLFLAGDVHPGHAAAVPSYLPLYRRVRARALPDKALASLGPCCSGLAARHPRSPRFIWISSSFSFSPEVDISRHRADVTTVSRWPSFCTEDWSAKASSDIGKKGRFRERGILLNATQRASDRSRPAQRSIPGLKITSGVNELGIDIRHVMNPRFRCSTHGTTIDRPIGDVIPGSIWDRRSPYQPL